ncbi:MAG TPA: YihY/virulence factor BrkB family protein [Candidatus Angelobacter sp.]|nr:YihY/virulence factor BrkB family protein [Candidatus Angelobacter sp.]
MKLPDPVLGLIELAWRTLRLFVNANGWSWSGALGLFLFLSVPPLMVASAFLASIFFPENEAKAFVLTQAIKFVPAQSQLMESVLVRDEPIATGAGVVSLAFLLFSGSRMFAALASAINRMWNRTDHLSFWDTQRSRIWLLGLSVVLLALAGAAEAAIGAVTDSAAGEQVWLLEAQVLPFALIGLFLFVAYRVLPEAEVTWQHAAIGAVLATIGARISQAVMGVMSDLGTFDTPYGELAGVGLLATWAFVVGVAVLLGASLVAVLGDHDRESGQA